MSGGALDPFRMVAAPELLAAVDDAVSRAVNALSTYQSDLASKGLHPWQLKPNHSGSAPQRDATRCQLCFMIHTELAMDKVAYE